MDKPPTASARGVRSGPNLVQPAQARGYAKHLRELADQWDAAADLTERLRAEAASDPAAKGRAPGSPAEPSSSSTSSPRSR